MPLIFHTLKPHDLMFCNFVKLFNLYALPFSHFILIIQLEAFPAFFIQFLFFYLYSFAILD